MNRYFEHRTLTVSRETEVRPRGSLGLGSPRELLVARSIRGAFDSRGRLVTDTMRLLGKREERIDRVPERLPECDVVEVCDEEVVWAGALMTHYGHFLCESPARLWPLLPGGPLEGRRAVWTTPFRPPFVREWMSAFGVQHRLLPPHGAVRFTSISVPEPAWRLDSWVTAELRDVHMHVRDRLEMPPAPEVDVLWFSRSGLRRNRVTHDEVLLEWLLREHVTVLRPETMTIAEQVAAIEASRAVVGVVGSAFHTMLMARKLPECLLICPERVRSAHPAQDRLLETNATFLHGLATVETTSRHWVMAPQGHRVLIPETLRALGSRVMPKLLEDRRLASLAYPERQRVGDELDVAVTRVLLDPHSMDARMKLGAKFRDRGALACALEQFRAVAELADDYALAPMNAARILKREKRLQEAAAMARRTLSIDPTMEEALAYLE